MRKYGASIYRTAQWKEVRLQAKRRDNWRCVQCGARGRLEVDHVQPLRLRPDLAFDLDNLQSLCPACHSKKTIVEVGIQKPSPAREKWKAAVRELTRER